MHSQTSLVPTASPRADGSTSSNRSLPRLSDSLTSITQPTLSPPRSAIQSGHLAQRAARGFHYRDPFDGRGAAGVLDLVFAAAVEIPGGSGGGAAAGVAAHGPGALRAAGHRAAQPGGRALCQAHGRHAAVLVSGSAAGLRALQPAVHGAAGGGGLRRGRPQTGGGLLVPGGFARGHLPARDRAAGRSEEHTSELQSLRHLV